MQDVDKEIDSLNLAEVICQLREEIQRAIDEGREKHLRFGIESAEVELKLGVVRSGQGKLGLKFWVLDTEARSQASREVVHTVKLRLRPHQMGDGRPGEVQVSEGLDQRPR